MAFNPFSFLLGQQGSTVIPQTVGPEILVQRDLGGFERPEAAMPRYGDAPSRPEVLPRYILNDDRIAPQPEELDEILPRKGMFGVKGTLRDVLGVLGDAFLVQGGGKAVYQPQRERERAGDALFGFSQNPEQAIERLAAVNPELAAEVQQQYLQNQYQQGMLDSTERNRLDQANNRAFDNLEKGWNRIARWVAGGMPYERVVAGASNYGINPEDLAELGVTPLMTEDERAQFGSMDMTTNQIMNIPFTERRVATGERNAATAERNAATSERRATTYDRTAGSSARPRADTELEYYRQITSKPESERTKAERDYVKRYLEGTGGRNSNGRRAVSPSPSSNSRFR